MTDIETIATQAAQRAMLDLRAELVGSHGVLLKEHDVLLKSTDHDNPGIIKQIQDLRDEVRDNRITQRWIIGLLFTILAVVVVCVVLLVMLWIQISVLAVKIQ